MPASIASSVIVSDAIQKDLRRWIQELHTDSVGQTYPRFYQCAANFDANAALTAYAATLLGNLKDTEIAANVASVTANGSLAVTTFVYSTQAQNLPALREAYRNATRTDAIMIGDFLNTLTDAQLQNIFNMTAGQVTTLRTNKLTPATSLATSIRASVGQ